MTDAPSMAARLFAVDPVGLGGVLLLSAAGEARDAWLRSVRQWLPDGAPWRRLPAGTPDDRLLGGPDLAATLAAGRTVLRRGVLAEADGGVVLLAMAERLEAGVAARIAAVMDVGCVSTRCAGASCRDLARIGVVALDERCNDDEGVPGALAERLALHVRLHERLYERSHVRSPPLMADDRRPSDADRAASLAEIAHARALLPAVRAGDDVVAALCEVAQSLGVDSLRACWLALRTACVAAALRGSLQVEAEDAAWAGRLVLAPRARAWPAGTDPAEFAGSDEPLEDSSLVGQCADRSEGFGDRTPASATSDDDSGSDAACPASGGASVKEISQAGVDESIVAPAAASLPAVLLASILSVATPDARRAGQHAGGSGTPRRSLSHGRPVGAQRDAGGGAGRLDLLETLRAAAPWQQVRRREQVRRDGVPRVGPSAILVRRDDFRVRSYRQRNESTTLFAVDASGSQALHRLAEAKGAVEVLLSDCYVRRDRVAVLAFRGAAVQVLLPPTRSLARAKRCLAGLPGGGATPLAAGLDAARQLALAIVRQGGTPSLVMLTDGKANIGRDGRPGRAAAQADAVASARAWRSTGLGALLVDTAPQPQALASELAREMRARYVALPCADARALARLVAAHGR